MAKVPLSSLFKIKIFHSVSFRGRIIQDLPKLKQLDEVEVTSEEKLEAGFKTEEDEDDDDEEDEEEDKPEDKKEKAGSKSNYLLSELSLPKIFKILGLFIHFNK